jgi:hypothetical protein
MRGSHRNCAAICLFVSPGTAQANTIRERNANACADFARRVHLSNCARSSSVNINSAFGRTVLAIHQFYNLTHELLALDIRRQQA